MTDKDLLSRQEARTLAEASHKAWLTYRELTQEQVDVVVEAMAAAGLRESERLARMAVEETGYGKPRDKHLKNRLICENLAAHIRGLKTVGVISETPSVIEIAEPVGVVAAIIPSTNPTSTVMYKCIISLKARNTVVISPHPAAQKCSIETARVMAEAAEAAGAPPGVILCMETSTQEGSQELMSHKHVSVILSTGGPGIVKAAYSSGKPAFGVGPGNVPAYVDRSADVPKAVKDVLAGKCFDYGTVCASEQAIIVDAPVKEQAVDELIRNGGYIMNDEEIARVSAVLMTHSGAINPELVGRSPQTIARRAGFEIPDTVEALIAPLTSVGRDVPLSKEKLSPILAMYVVDGWREGCELCKKILGLGGMGHTLGIHARDRDVVMAFGLEKPAFRIIVNSPTTLGAVGYTTDLPPAMTLGCGAMGNNITSDNIGPMHLINIKRIAFETKPLSHSRATSPDSDGRSRSMPVSGVRSPLSVRAATRDDMGGRIDAFIEGKGLFGKRVERPPCPAAPCAGGSSQQPPAVVPPPRRAAPAGPKPVDFVCEDDVRRAFDRGEKIIIGPKTIITPAARDLGEEKKVFG